MKLVKYDAARKALAAAVSVDEVKRIHAQAEALKAYARIAKDDKLLADAAKIRMRAERRLGELMAVQAKAVGKATARGSNRHKKLERVSGKPALAEVGIDKNLAHRARRAARVPEKTFESQVEAIGEEIISGAARRVRQGDKRERRDERERELAKKIKALPKRRYGVILADPAWRFEPFSRETGMDRAADNHYPTQPLGEIKALDVPSIAADVCVLFLWRTAPMNKQALELMEHWGFEYQSEYIWRKVDDDGGVVRGPGYWNSNAHEVLMIGTRGRPPAPAPGTQWPSVIDAPPGEHSAKPEVFLEMIEEYYPNLPKIELNRRGPPRDGWDSWGQEAEEATDDRAHDEADDIASQGEGDRPAAPPRRTARHRGRESSRERAARTADG